MFSWLLKHELPDPSLSKHMGRVFNLISAEI